MGGSTLRIRHTPNPCVFWALALAASLSLSAGGDTAPIAMDDQAHYSGGPVTVDVLANDVERDGEALEVAMLSTTCPGVVSLDFDLMTLTITGAMPESCTIAYRITDERGSFANAVVTVSDNTEIFSDSFESGDASRWTVFEVGS